MVREAPGLREDAVGREAGYSQLARAPYASMAPASAPDLQMCLQRRVVPNNGSIGAEPSDGCRRGPWSTWSAELFADFL